jgi:hypothetical protein
VAVPYPGASDSGRKYGDTGQQWQGLNVYVDPNIPTFGTTSKDYVIVADEAAVYAFTSSPVLATITGPSAGSLEVIVRLVSYGAVLSRWPSAVQGITGTALSPVTF